jgi:hypothetical protein
MGTLIVLAALAAAPAAVEVRLDPPSTVCFAPQKAVVTVVNNGDATLTAQVGLLIAMPFGGQQQPAATTLVAAHGQARVELTYELYEPGRHTFTVTVNAGGAEAAKCQSEVEVPEPANPPALYPNYYRGRPDLPRPTGVEPVVSIGDDNRLYLQGKPWFPLGIYHTPQSEADARELAAAGFDLVTVGELPPAALRPVLDRLGGWGLRAWVPLASQLQFAEGDVAAKKADIAALVAGVGDHPTLALWESIDEPAWGGTPAWGLRAGYEYLRALDPRRPIWTNHAPRNRVATLAFYNQATDIAGCDIYPVPTPQTQSDLPNKTLGVVGDETNKNRHAVRDEKPVFMVLQGFAWRCLENRDDPQAVYPTFEQSRFMAYDAIVSGARGLLWWGIQATPRPSPFWSDLKALVSELHALKPILEAPDDDDGLRALRSLGNGLSYADRHWNGHRFLLAVNAGTAPASIGKSHPGGKWHCLFGDPGLVAADGDFIVTVPPGGVRVVTDDPDFNPVRGDWSAEGRAARPPQPLPTEPGNAIPNPGFEVDADGLPAGWEVRLPFTVSRDTQVAHSGQASLRIDSPAAGATPLAVLNGITVKPDTKYRLSGWMRSDTPGVSARFYAEWHNASGWHGFILPWTQPSAEWREFSVAGLTSNNPEGRLYVVVQAKDQGRVWFDDLALRPEP